MNIEINLDSGKHHKRQSDMSEIDIESHNLDLRRRQLANEQRYLISDLSFDDEIQLDLSTASKRDIERFMRATAVSPAGKISTALINDFNKLILPYKEDLQDILTKKWINSRPKDWLDINLIKIR